MIRTEHRGDNWKFSFVKYSPVDSDKKLPLVLQLHGAGERGEGKEDLCKVDVHGFSKLLEKEDFDCHFVMPQCPTDSFWAAHVESIIAFVEQLKEEYDIDEDRVYLTGLSMGGFGTWFTAMARPDLFAAIAPVCGGGMEWNAHVLKMPIRTFHGAEDNVVPPAHTDMMVAKLKEIGADVTYTKVDGVGHNVWDCTYDRDLAQWLLSKTRK